MNKPSFPRGLTALAVGVLLVVLSARTGAASYTISGAEGFGAPHGPALSGSLLLDVLASRNYTPLAGGENGSQSVYSSPNQILSCSFGGWSFMGIADIYVSDRPPFWSNGQENWAPDSWIARASVTGPTVSSLTPTFISLFYYTSASGITNSDLLPPGDPLTSPNPYDFQFALDFQDLSGGTQTVFGQLFTIQSVPEPGAGSLLMLGMAMLASRRKQKRQR